MEKHEVYINQLKEFLILRNYSQATLKSYTSALRHFLIWREKEDEPGVFHPEQARRYILYRYGLQKKWQTINGDYSALMHFFTKVLEQQWNVRKLPRPRKEFQLPDLLSKEQVSRMINSAMSLKHQAFMCLLYATGLRLSEALNLCIAHIDSERMQIHVVKGKGNKDRYVDLPPRLLEILRNYFKVYRPYHFLFNGRYRNTRLSIRAAQHAVNEARKKAGIKTQASPHTFRHCFATHHLENGTDLVYLQQQLGHKRLRTTARYIHLCKQSARRIVHPINDLDLCIRNLPSEKSFDNSVSNTSDNTAPATNK